MTAVALALVTLGLLGPTQEVVDQYENSVAQVVTEYGSGTGFVVAPGYLVTNAHVIEGSYGAEALFEDGDEVECSVLDEDEGIDLALLACDTGDRASMPIAAGAPELGADVLVLGYPGTEFSAGTESLTATGGLVSRVRTADGYLQTDAALNPGNSGGPVIDIASAEVVGVATAVDRYSENTGFAVPADTILGFVGPIIRDEGPTDQSEDSGSDRAVPVTTDSGGDRPIVVVSLGLCAIVGWALFVVWSRSRSRPATPGPPVEPEPDIEIVLVGEPRSRPQHTDDNQRS